MNIVSNVKKIKNKLSPKTKTKRNHRDQESGKSIFYDDTNSGYYYDHILFDPHALVHKKIAFKNFMYSY